jgi:hypothetical protein
MKSIDNRIIEIRKSPYLRRTESLLCFGEMFNWDDISGRMTE